MAAQNLPAVGRRGRLRVLIIAADTPRRTAWKHLLSRSAEFKVVRTVSPPVDAATVDGLDRSSAQVVLLDDSAAHEATIERLRRALRSTALVVLGEPRGPDEARALLSRGVNGFVSLAMPAAHIEALLSAMALGHVVAPREVLFAPASREVASEEGSRQGPGSPLARLTPREKRILALLGRGTTNKAIAAKLQISGATVKAHVHSILSKLGVRNRGEAAALWRDHQSPPQDSE
jgi:DNA-binding NarL/FixJ family response regulator